ncbi:MAG: orotidine-5'-phosphate decarboxylase [Deltaproteobacteria bacterium]|jgi:orotidine-5'-phosphate decarboxylase|nr:orotidine-5'-phosphate decarboxylase [Deltaproteobacteria bacterium]
MKAESLRKSLDPAKRLALALDVPTMIEALGLARRLSGKVGFFKVGLELFVAEGPVILWALKCVAPDSGIFLDLKFHDIPATVGKAMAAIKNCPMDLVSVHAQGGPDMIKAAVAMAGEALVLGVTVLTSLDPGALGELSGESREPGAYAALLAQRAIGAGCGGLVCSSQETADFRARFGPGPFLVTPGIRPDWVSVANDDQKRIGTVSSAIAMGSDLLVIGRPIREAKDPVEACDRVLEEIAQGLKKRDKPSGMKVSQAIKKLGPPKGK